MCQGSLSEASSSVFLAYTFALLGFCISGTLGFARHCVYILTLLPTFIFFSAVVQYFFATVCSGGNSLITYQLHFRPCLVV